LPPTHTFINHSILYASTLRKIHFDVSALSEYNMKVSLHPAVACAAKLPLLRCITVELPRITPHRSDEPYDASGAICDLVGDFNLALGVRGKLMVVGAASGMGEPQVWFWEGSFAVGER
jgi:hypothetical protein